MNLCNLNNNALNCGSLYKMYIILLYKDIKLYYNLYYYAQVIKKLN